MRLHALDALRAAMMLLGLVLHSAASYTTGGPLPEWPFKDPQSHVTFNLLIFVIHLFRMPLFFLVAGFFGALLYARDGAWGFVRNRVARVLVPLVVFWVAVMPLVVSGFGFAIWYGGDPLPIREVAAVPWLRQPVLGHFWFLYDLLLFYAAAVVIVPIAARLPGAAARWLDEAVEAIVARAWGPVALAAVTTLTLIPMGIPGIETSGALVPPLRILAAYGVFFAFGWCLYRRRDRIDSIGATWKRQLALGAAATVAALVFAGAPRQEISAAVVISSAAAGLATWLLIFGITGAFIASLGGPRPIVRYVSDASYWMYLVHLPLTIWIPGLLVRSGAGAFAKFTVVLGLTLAVTLATYHYGVRATVIGAMLNGRRYPRALPAPAPELQPAHPAGSAAP